MKMNTSEPTLKNITVLDVSRVLAGPLAAQILGDHGADVIKVESFSGDDTRGYGPPFFENVAPYYIGLNRNKRGVSIDLEKEAGRILLHKLISKSDVLIENYKLSTWKKWGIDCFSEIHEKNPRLIHCRITGFGDDGPMGGLPGYDAAIQAYSGLMSINGDGENKTSTRIGVPIIDLSTGTNAALAISMALYQREISGFGQMIETCLLDTGLSLLHPHAANVLYGGEANITGNAHGNIYPYDLFPTKTVPLYVAVGNDNQFCSFCAVLGVTGLPREEKYKCNRDRVKNQKALKEALVKTMETLDGELLFKKLLDAGVPCAPVYSVKDSIRLPQSIHRQMLVQREGYQGVGIPIKMKRTPGSVRKVPPSVGEHTLEILNHFDFDISEIEQLLKENVVQQGK